MLCAGAAVAGTQLHILHATALLFAFLLVLAFNVSMSIYFKPA